MRPADFSSRSWRSPRLAHRPRARRASTDEFLFLEYQTRAARVSLHSFLGAAFGTLAAGFVPLGHLVGRTVSGPRPLRLYAENVFGSLLGIAVFGILGAAGTSPWLWVALSLAVTWGALVASRPRGRVSFGWYSPSILLSVAACVLAWHGGRSAVWSPYQKITTDSLRVHPTLGLVQEWKVPLLPEAARAELSLLPATSGFTVRVNDDSYQTPVDLSDAAVAKYPSLAPLRLQYDLAFSGGGAVGDVLVLGAGTGNDVAAALRKGAIAMSDAVEIDPEILKLGRQHPEHPYDDPRVFAQQDDARAFLAQTTRSYDTIVYGLLDSHVLLSQMSNVRLDSYVFTAESFALARAHLKPGGLLVVSHAVGQPWFVDRMRATLADAFNGRPPMVVLRARSLETRSGMRQRRYSRMLLKAMRTKSPQYGSDNPPEARRAGCGESLGLNGATTIVMHPSSTAMVPVVIGIKQTANAGA